MSAMIPMAVFGLEVPAGDIPIPGRDQIRSAYRITMAAVDPTDDSNLVGSDRPRSTLKIIRTSLYDDEDDYDEDDEDDLDSDDFDADEFERGMAMAGGLDDDDSEEDDSEEEVNGGPSDPSKSKSARKAAAEKAIAKLLAEEDDMDMEDMDEELPLTNGVNGIKKSPKALGKMPIDDEDEDEDEDDLLEDDLLDGWDEGPDVEEFTICTLDPDTHYQQPLDITVGEDERVWFKVTGPLSVFLTGNYVVPADDDSDEYDSDVDEEMDYDLEPDSDELDEDSEEDELDELEDPRITELEEEDEEEDEAPALVKAPEKKSEKKGQNKRPAADDDTDLSAGLDEMIAKTKADEGVNGKLSKKQLKKLKKNDGSAAVTATESKSDVKPEADASSSAKSDKKVQFAKNLEQGPTPTKDAKGGAQEKTAKATLGVKVVQGVKIDDKKIGTGPAAKSGDRVGMRYIGKLEKDNKVFDSNKKGKPFSFKLGSGEVIKGWDIGIQGMSIGGERRITIPAHLGYGAKGTAGIPGNSTLVFDVKLLENKGK